MPTQAVFKPPLRALLLATACPGPLASTATTAAVSHAVRTLQPVDAQADVALLRRALETVHPGLYRYADKPTIDAAFGRLEAAVEVPLTELQLHRQIALLLAAIHCDHTKAEWPMAFEAYRTKNPTHLPLRFKLIESRMIVTATDGQPGALPADSEIVAINGVPVPRLLTTLGHAVACDGRTVAVVANARCASSGSTPVATAVSRWSPTRRRSKAADRCAGVASSRAVEMRCASRSWSARRANRCFSIAAQIGA